MAEFSYHDPFEHGEDATEYRLLTKDYVSVKELDGQEFLVDTIRHAAGQLQVPFDTEIRKGTSDANFFGAVSVPVVDGMGPIGFHDHSRKEYILLESLFDRIKLCAAVLYDLENSGFVGY